MDHSLKRVTKPIPNGLSKAELDILEVMGRPKVEETNREQLDVLKCQCFETDAITGDPIPLN